MEIGIGKGNLCNVKGDGERWKGGCWDIDEKEMLGDDEK